MEWMIVVTWLANSVDIVDWNVRLCGIDHLERKRVF